MRIIKFRAWDYTHGKMVYDDDTGSVSCINSKLNVTIPAWIEYDGTNWQSWPLPNHELMQFTGLHDRNGKEIYEGDLVRINNLTENWKNGEPPFDWRVLAVEYNQYAWAFNNSVLYFPMSTYKDRAGEFYDYEIEVIGNIYENPELLNQQP